MRTSITRGWHCAAVTLLSMGCVCLVAQAAERRPSKAKETDPQSSETATRYVRQALEAELAGDTDMRSNLLRQALELSPDSPAAHWQLGQVRIGDRWVSVVDATKERSDAGTVDQDRQMRNSVPPDYLGQLQMARWCAANGLVEQERLHLLASLRQRRTPEAIKRLGLVRYKNRLMFPAEVAERQQREKAAEALVKEWKPKLERWTIDINSRDAARRDAALAQIRAIDKPAVIPMLETSFGRIRHEAGEAVVECLSHMPQPEATESLVRYAVLSPHEEVRTAAARALKPRSVFAYAPLLLSSLQAPLEVEFTPYDAAGVVGYRMKLFREGPLFNTSEISTVAVRPEIVVTPTYVDRAGNYTAAPSRKPSSAPVAGNVFQTAEMAQSANQSTAQMNERVGTVLRTATGVGLDNEPRGWWNWWNEYNELNVANEKPLYELARHSFTSYAVSSPLLTPEPPPPPPVRPFHSCFVPGTLVWTQTGTMPIEKIQQGELVLAQDVDSGELAFKTVQGTTQGPALAVVAIRADGQNVCATLGHLFWVSGTGWRMAKDLRPGDRLHTTDGPITVESVEPAGETSCHNLIVADYANYFVTDRRILVHDINVRGPTDAVVPGLVDPQLAAQKVSAAGK